MVIEDEFLPKQLERRSHHKKGIGRIVSVNDVKTTPRENINADDQTSRREVAVFKKITKRGFQFKEKQTCPTEVSMRGLLK